MTRSVVHVTLDASVATLCIDRLGHLNALDVATIEAFEDALDGVLARADVAAVIVTGRGPAFVAGAQISELAMGEAAMLDLASSGRRAFEKVSRARKPIVAAVNGYALGGGCELALACHLCIAATEARFGLPEVKLGLLPGWGGTQRLARRVGRGRALELLLTGEPIDATEAYRIGLVNRVVPGTRLLDSARHMLQQILGNAPLAIAACLDAVDVGLDMSLGDALEHEADLFTRLARTADALEGTRAFLARRPPGFLGR